MRYREKLTYIALGGTLVLVGMVAGGLFSPLGAQSQRDVSFGKITCTELVVADNIPHGSQVWIMPNSVSVFHGMNLQTFIGSSPLGGSVMVSGGDNKDLRSSVTIEASEKESRIYIFDLDGMKGKATTMLTGAGLK